MHIKKLYFFSSIEKCHKKYLNYFAICSYKFGIQFIVLLNILENKEFDL